MNTREDLNLYSPFDDIIQLIGFAPWLPNHWFYNILNYGFSVSKVATFEFYQTQHLMCCMTSAPEFTAKCHLGSLLLTIILLNLSRIEYCTCTILSNSITYFINYSHIEFISVNDVFESACNGAVPSSTAVGCIVHIRIWWCISRNVKGENRIFWCFLKR